MRHAVGAKTLFAAHRQELTELAQRLPCRQQDQDKLEPLAPPPQMDLFGR